MGRSTLLNNLLTITFCVVFFYLFFKAMKTGKIYFKGGDYDRDDNPVAFWLFAILVLTVAMMLFLFSIGTIFGPAVMDAWQWMFGG